MIFSPELEYPINTSPRQLSSQNSNAGSGRVVKFIAPGPFFFTYNTPSTGGEASLNQTIKVSDNVGAAFLQLLQAVSNDNQSQPSSGTPLKRDESKAGPRKNSFKKLLNKCANFFRSIHLSYIKGCKASPRNPRERKTASSQWPACPELESEYPITTQDNLKPSSTVFYGSSKNIAQLSQQEVPELP